VPGGVLPALRSLSIHLWTSQLPYHTVAVGSRWREDNKGHITEATEGPAEQWFDGGYLLSVAKAAPNLRELELFGESRDPIVRGCYCYLTNY
jgi:hypothetical protein